MFCASSTTTRRQSTAAQRRAVPGGERVGGDHQVGRSARGAASSPRSRSAPWWTCTRRSGVNRAASRCQLPTTDIGQTSSVGPVRGAAPGSTAAPPAHGQQRQQLDGLAQPHVVGQDAAEAQAGRGRPARPGRAPGTGAASPWNEAGGRRPARAAAVARAGEQVAQPAVGVDGVDQRQSSSGRAARPPARHRPASRPRGRAPGTAAPRGGAGRPAPPTGRAAGPAAP